MRSLQNLSSILLIVLLRILRVWNQTGQKHAGEPDIAKTVLPGHKILLWLLVLVTYLQVVQRLSRRAIPWASRQLSSAASLALGITALSFKVAFTKADAPELVHGLHFFVLKQMDEATLVAQARAVIGSIIAMMVLTCGPSIYQYFYQGGKASGKAVERPG